VKSWELFDDGLHSLDTKRADQLARISESRDIAFTVHGPICDLNIATLNPEVRPHMLRRMDRSLRVSAHLGAKRWVLHPGTHGALSWVHSGEDWKVNLNNIRQLHSLGRKLGVEVVIENISAGQAILGRTDDFLKLYEAWAQAPGITLDVGHSHIKRETDEYLRKFTARIRHVHVHDNMGDLDTHLAVRSGTIPWRKVLRSLVDAGFVEEIVVESVKGPFASYDRVKEILRSLQ
jgi:sugar phosphate isomerase/epimerase